VLKVASYCEGELGDKQMSKRGQDSYAAKNFVTNYLGYLNQRHYSDMTIYIGIRI